MASNFRIIIYKKRNGLDLKLTGDFDGTSEFELINVLEECPTDNSRIFIHTCELKNVFPFERDPFCKFLVPIHGRPSRFVFTGNERLALSPKKIHSICQDN